MKRAYSREEIMSWCEEQEGVDYVFGLATNSQLKMRANDVIEKAQADYEQRLTPASSFLEQLFSPAEDRVQWQRNLFQVLCGIAHCPTKLSLLGVALGV